MKTRSFNLILLVVAPLFASACSNLPPLPPEFDGSAGQDSTARVDMSTVSRDTAGDAPTRVDGANAAETGSTGDVPGAPPTDGAAVPPVDSRIDAPVVLVCPRDFADCNGDDSDGCETPINTIQNCGGCKNACAAVANGTAACVSSKCEVKCNAGYGDCDGKYENGCETALNTASHCGGCGSACGAVANGSPVCTNGKCAVKCNDPYQDCDGKYDNGCEIPVGRANSCNKSGLAAFSGGTPPCGTPYCGAPSSSGSVAKFDTWYCSFCDHCTIFSNGGSYCLYGTSDSDGNFSSDRCSTCCVDGGTPKQSCGRQ